MSMLTHLVSSKDHIHPAQPLMNVYFYFWFCKSRWQTADASKFDGKIQSFFCHRIEKCLEDDQSKTFMTVQMSSVVETIGKGSYE